MFTQTQNQNMSSMYDFQHKEGQCISRTNDLKLQKVLP